MVDREHFREYVEHIITSGRLEPWSLDRISSSTIFFRFSRLLAALRESNLKFKFNWILDDLTEEQNIKDWHSQIVTISTQTKLYRSEINFNLVQTTYVIKNRQDDFFLLEVQSREY